MAGGQETRRVKAERQGIESERMVRDQRTEGYRLEDGEEDIIKVSGAEDRSGRGQRRQRVRPYGGAQSLSTSRVR